MPSWRISFAVVVAAVVVAGCARRAPDASSTTERSVSQVNDSIGVSNTEANAINANENYMGATTGSAAGYPSAQASPSSPDNRLIELVPPPPPKRKKPR
jgi:hypothetical protein